MSETPTRSRITIFGSDIRKPPLLDSTEPHMILIRDAFQDPMLLLVRILSDDTWGLCTKGDPDWYDQLVKYGLAQLAPGTSAKDLIAKGVGACIKAP